MAASAPPRPTLSPFAAPFEPRPPSLVPQQAPPVLVTYHGPPLQALPPPGLVTLPFPWPCPPPPGLLGPCPGGRVFPPCVEMAMPGAFPPPSWAPPMVMPHGPVAGPPVVHCAPAAPPQQPFAAAVPQHDGEAPQRPAHAGRARSARPRPWIDVPPRRRGAAGPAPSASSPGTAAAKEEPANEPSPRSVLDVTTASPPVSPAAQLPRSFPYPEDMPPAPPRRRRQTARALGQAAGGEARHRGQKPRRSYYVPDSTSLMIRNIPNGFTRKRLMNIIDQHCAEVNAEIAAGGGDGDGVMSAYDFLYVPIDFKTRSNKGYAFLNFTTPAAALRLRRHLHGHQWKVANSHKTCEVADAKLQGLEALVAHFDVSRFECDTEEYLPVKFRPPRDGARPAEGEVLVVGRLAMRAS
ncbi:hypothetical protein ACP70R_006005 [Stipagrostis hirtigluma subsp. patula]